MIKFLQKLLTEPLLSFLLLGSLLYLYYSNVTQDEISRDTTTQISITPFEVQALQKEYVKKYKKKMSAEELPLYVENLFRQKVLLEESIRLKLHKSDALIAKRLVEMMEFILLGSVEYKEPTEKELHTYYLKNIDEYSEVESLSFVHIYFSSATNNIDELYSMLKMSKDKPIRVENIGDRFEGLHTYENVSYDEVKDRFGKYFASKIFKLKKAMWHKGIYSKWGVHLVYITQKLHREPYGFDEVEDRVYSDYLEQKREETIDAAYTNILQNYNLKLDK